MTRHAQSSLADYYRELPDKQRAKALSLIEDPRKLLTSWAFWARPNQILPGSTAHSCSSCAGKPSSADWAFWLLMAGRGNGKTRTGAETILEWVKRGRRRLALVGMTAADVRDVMVEGISGIMACAEGDYVPRYEPSKRRLTWSNGAIATCYTAEEPRKLRGPAFDGAWCDEIAQWQYPEAWDQLQFGLREGDNPQVVVTTTPRPSPLIREILNGPATHVTRGSTFENEQNLSRRWFEKIVRKYRGTRLGRQELEAELLEDVPGALWTHSQLDRLRLAALLRNELRRVVVAIDPSGSSAEGTSDQGIAAAGVTHEGLGVFLEDATVHLSPDGWGRRAVELAWKWNADCIVAEQNYGGDMVELVVRTAAASLNQERKARGEKTLPLPRFKLVVASRGKHVRAEPVAALYEQNRIKHLGTHGKLEDELCCFTPDGYIGGRAMDQRDDDEGPPASPNRADAAIWAFTELMLGELAPSYEGIPGKIISPWSKRGVRQTTPRPRGGRRF